MLIPQLRYQVINNIRVAHQMQPEVFVVKHTANVRVIEYTLLGSLNRIAFFLNNFFEDIDLCCRSIFLVINEQKNNLSIHFMCNKIVSDDPGTTRFSFTFRLYCHSYFADAWC